MISKVAKLRCATLQRSTENYTIVLEVDQESTEYGCTHRWIWWRQMMHMIIYTAVTNTLQNVLIHIYVILMSACSIII